MKHLIDEKREKKNCQFDEYAVFEWILQLLNALNYLHSNRMIHRNVKPSNVFVYKDQQQHRNNVKLGDVAIVNLNFDYNYPDLFKYSAPEVIERGAYEPNSDMWSLGCLIYELLTLRRLPFTRYNYANDLNESINTVLSLKTSIHFKKILKE